MSNPNPPRRRSRSPRNGGDDRAQRTPSASDVLDDSILNGEDMLYGEQDYEVIEHARQRTRRMHEEEE